jgi:DNA-binding winged helix-turn-helix (wHTH) protein/tetratricopeptide (TPR) repeat protein
MNAAMGVLRFKGFTLDVAASALMKGDRQVALRPQPFKVLTYLARNSGRLVGNNELVEKCWDNPKETKPNSLAQCIKAIREALGETDQEIIRTVHGRGYVFAPPVSEVSAAESPQQRGHDRIETPAPALPEPGGPSAPPRAPAPPPAATAARELRSDWRRLSRARPYALAAAIAAAVVLMAGGWAVWSWVTRPAELTMMAVPSLAILPIKVLGEEPDRISLGVALTSEIGTELSRAPRGYDLHIRLAPDYSGPVEPPWRAGRELGVRYIVVGSTRAEGDTRLINIQVIEAASGRPIWAEPFTYAPGEPKAQNRVAARIARMIQAQLMRAEARLPLPSRPGANHYAMLGRAKMSGGGGLKANDEAMAYFDKGRALDPDSVPALQGAARTRVNKVLNNWVPKEQRGPLLKEAGAALDRAFNQARRDPGLHVARGAYLRALGKYAEAIAEFQHAVELNPNYTLAHAELGRAKVEVGLAHETVAHIEEAIRLNPNEPYRAAWYYWAGLAEVHLGRYTHARNWFLKTLSENRAYPNTFPFLAVAYAGDNQWEDAHSYMQKHLDNFPRFSIAGWRLALPHSNPTVTEQRLRIEALLRQLGAPETPPPDPVQLGSRL